MTTGIALAVALLADLGTFIEHSASTMTTRAIAAIPVDWQVELVHGGSIETVSAAIEAAMPTKHKELVGYADVDGFELTTASGTQSTGSGQVVGFQPSYATNLPAGFRMLSGDATGALLLQQTAANLHAVPGDKVLVHRPGLDDASITISGIVDLKTADSLFQAIGVPPGAAPQAPPDNAVLLPMPEWHAIFDAEAIARPQSVRTQIHVVLDHQNLPSDPNDAYRYVLQAGHNFEARIAGSALLANNIAAQLDAARGDALYARVLFLFLGAPGVVLAGLLTITLAASGGERRRRDQSLLRLRGASLATIIRFAAFEALTVGIVGAGVGAAIAALTAPLFGQELFSVTRAHWSVVAGVGGLALAVGAVVVPSWRSARSLSVAAVRQTLLTNSTPIWERLYLDLICLGIAAVVFWNTAATGYQVVLATEGVTAISVDYASFLAPLLLWIGAALLTLRLVRSLLQYGRKSLDQLLAGAAGVAPAVASSLSRQRQRLAAGVGFAALAIAFAVSTAVFNTTYQGQARVDALLTNGADVTVTGTTSFPASQVINQLRAISGVDSAELMQHRFAYVGTDLQDLYGIDPALIGNATTLSNAYFQNGDAAGTIATLAGKPDAVLVSDETVGDFQLTLGDTINLRLQGADGQYRRVPFTFVGVVREFPTAPRDSFLVANAAYVAKMTGVDASEVALLRTSADRLAVKSAASDIVKAMPGANVTELGQAIHLVGSSLTSVDLAGLTALELSAAVLLAAGSTGLVLALGFADRRRSFAILAILGARQVQLGTFIVAEALVIVTGGVIFGAATGLAVAQVLVSVLQGVFDPPPEAVSVPWGFLSIVGIAALMAVAGAVANTLRETAIEPIRRLRELQ
ncbi:FtsX-like permease family protein [Devosia sp.]|uniref:FtsX-like permease family protein n=1 Tax=Devosia sp. TaxID=1871048 RepID=UPI003BAB7DDD